MSEQITCFIRYPFRVGEKIRIMDGPRKGDWEVIGIDEKKVSLRCPVKGIEVRWDRFCYQVTEPDEMDRAGGS